MSRPMSLRHRALALLTAGAIAGSLVVVAPAIASATPPASDRFSCAGGDYFRVEDGTLTQASDPNGTWTTLRATANVANAIGYRASDRYIYGMKPNSNNIWKVTTSSTTDLGAVTGLPTATYNVGGVDQATGKFYVSASQSSLYEVDIEALTATAVTFNSADFKLGQDVVIVDGWAWSVRGTNVYGLDLADTTQTRSYSFDASYLQSGTIGGAMWFDEADSSLLMEIRGTGVAVKFVGVGGASITTSNVAFSAPGTGTIDGASCRTTRLTVTPDGQSRVYGDPAPTYGSTVTGFILGEDATTAAGYTAPNCTSSYTSTTPVASSPLTISCSGGSASDYTFDTSATAQLTITFSPDSFPCASARFVRIVARELAVSNSLSGTWNFVRSTKPVSNAIAHRAADQFIYGFPFNSNHLLKVGVTGTTDLGAVTNLPVQQYIGADFDPATGLLYVVSKSGSVHKVDLSTMTATTFTMTASGGRVRAGQDIAIVDGYLWSAAVGFILKADLATGQITKYFGWTHGAIGAMWVNADNTVSAMVRSDAKIYQLADPASTSTLVASPLILSGQIDGATCR